MRRSRIRAPHLRSAAIALVLVACSGPATSSQAARTSGVPSPTPSARASGEPTEAPAATASAADGSAEAQIDLATLAGRIVFDDGQDIWSMNANGTDPSRLTDEPWMEFDPTLSPDGRVIVYRSEPEEYPQLWVMNVDGSDQRMLAAEGGFPSWSPDGSELAFAAPGGPTGQSWIGIMQPDGSGTRRVPGTDYGEYPSWSPDGKHIVFTSAHTGGRRMYVVDVDGSNFIELPAGEGTMVAWAPDGQSILFASHRDHGDNYRDIYSMRPDGSDVRRLTFNRAEAPAWSPDGRYVGFSAPGGFGVMRADGSGVTTVPVEGPAWVSFPDWS